MVALATTLFSSIGSAVASGASAVGSAMGIGGTAATAAGAAGTAGATAAGVSTAGSTIASILQGTATALSVFPSIGAANTEADGLDLAANDAERQKAFETLQGIERRSSIRRAMADAVGDQTTAYAASGVDLSFGSPTQARKEAYREADLGLATAVGTEQTRLDRLDERAANLRSRARSTRSAGVLSGVTSGIGGVVGILNRRKPSEG